MFGAKGLGLLFIRSGTCHLLSSQLYRSSISQNIIGSLLQKNKMKKNTW